MWQLRERFIGLVHCKREEAMDSTLMVCVALHVLATTLRFQREHFVVQVVIIILVWKLHQIC